MACKVDEMARKYGLDALDGELLAAHESGASLRDLEATVNQRLLRRALQTAGEDVLPGEVETIYELLTDEMVSPGAEVQVSDRLRRADIDADELRDDFVSYQTVRTHLRECLDRDTGTRNDVSLSSERETLFGLVGRTETVVRDSVNRLRAAGLVPIGPPDVTVTVRVVCTECNRRYRLSGLLSGDVCGCGSD
jgi:hypothetical protein